MSSWTLIWQCSMNLWLRNRWLLQISLLWLKFSHFSLYFDQLWFLSLTSISHRNFFNGVCDTRNHWFLTRFTMADVSFHFWGKLQYHQKVVLSPKQMCHSYSMASLSKLTSLVKHCIYNWLKLLVHFAWTIVYYIG